MDEMGDTCITAITACLTGFSWSGMAGYGEWGRACFREIHRVSLGDMDPMQQITYYLRNTKWILENSIVILSITESSCNTQWRHQILKI